MPSIDLENQYERLRTSAIRLLDALPAADQDPAGLREALVGLHLILDGNHSSADPGDTSPVPDPARHLRSRLDFTRTPTRPIELETEADDLSRDLAADRRTRGFDTGAPVRTVQLTGLQAMIIGELLQELATRLRPGQAFGSSRHGAPLADVASDLAKNITDHTVIGRG
ncbi:hypothetical protein ACFROC_00615 [Nocardia tengchongensis]|uniref:hypothetical protein n=1 Tax=Nocardia tengchongensis TaxID=2055889 RepID=UPI0036AE23E5